MKLPQFRIILSLLLAAMGLFSKDSCSKDSYSYDCTDAVSPVSFQKKIDKIERIVRTKGFKFAPRYEFSKDADFSEVNQLLESAFLPQINAKKKISKLRDEMDGILSEYLPLREYESSTAYIDQISKEPSYRSKIEALYPVMVTYNDVLLKKNAEILRLGSHYFKENKNNELLAALWAAFYKSALDDFPYRLDYSEARRLASFEDQRHFSKYPMLSDMILSESSSKWLRGNVNLFSEEVDRLRDIVKLNALSDPKKDALNKFYLEYVLISAQVQKALVQWNDKSDTQSELLELMKLLFYRDRSMGFYVGPEHIHKFDFQGLLSDLHKETSDFSILLKGGTSANFVQKEVRALSSFVQFVETLIKDMLYIDYRTSYQLLMNKGKPFPFPPVIPGRRGFRETI